MHTLVAAKTPIPFPLSFPLTYGSALYTPPQGDPGQPPAPSPLSLVAKIMPLVGWSVKRYGPHPDDSPRFQLSDFKLGFGI